jgi:hypothetical protein
MNNYLKKLYIVVLVGLGLLLIPSWGMYFYEEYIMDHTPAVVHKITIKNKDKQVCPGGMLLYEVDIDKKRDLPATVKRQLVNSYLISFDVIFPPRKPLGRHIYAGSLYVPKGAEVGDWFLRWTSEYPIPPRKRNGSPQIIAVSKDSDPFWVVDCGNSEKGPKGDRGKPGKDFWGK